MCFHPSNNAARPRLAIARQGGAIAIIVALSMAVLVGFVGLALDSGKLFVAKTELQNAADACALAAAQALTGASPSQLEAAELAGITTGAMNAVMFQAEVGSGTAETGFTFAPTVDARVTFHTSLNEEYEYREKDDIDSGEALEMRFARCTLSRPEIPTWFMQVLNVMPGVDIGDSTVSATAVATLMSSQTSCALPVALCSTALPAGTKRGTWIEGVIGPSGGSGEIDLTGNFKWIDFVPEDGVGTRTLKDLLTGAGVCNLATKDDKVGTPGNKASAAQAWNTRFGIYQAGFKQNKAIPDFTGYGYTELNWPSKENAYDDFRNTRRPVNAQFQWPAELWPVSERTGVELSNNADVMNNTYLAANGGDRRIAVAPVVDCDGFTGGSTKAPIVDWACMLMLHPLNTNTSGSGTVPPPTGTTRMYLEFLGFMDEPGPGGTTIPTPCATLGMPSAPGGPGPKVPALVQ